MRARPISHAIAAAVIVILTAAAAACAQAPPPKPASLLLEETQSLMLQRVPGTRPFRLKLELTEFAPDGKPTATGTYEETWQDSNNWRREATLGTKHTAQTKADGEQDHIVTAPLDPQGVTISDLARWALPAFDADPDSSVMQNIVSHAPGGDVPMVRIGTRSVTEQQPFKADALAWFLAANQPKLLGVMDGNYFIEYFDRTLLNGRSVASKWTASAEAHLFLKAKLLLIEPAAK